MEKQKDRLASLIGKETQVKKQKKGQGPTDPIKVSLLSFGRACACYLPSQSIPQSAMGEWAVIAVGRQRFGCLRIKGS